MPLSIGGSGKCRCVGFLEIGRVPAFSLFYLLGHALHYRC